MRDPRRWRIGRAAYSLPRPLPDVPPPPPRYQPASRTPSAAPPIPSWCLPHFASQAVSSVGRAAFSHLLAFQIFGNSKVLVGEVGCALVLTGLALYASCRLAMLQAIAMRRRQKRTLMNCRPTRARRMDSSLHLAVIARYPYTHVGASSLEKAFDYITFVNLRPFQSVDGVYATS